MSGFYDNICNMLIRPARQTYSEYDLGPPALGSLALRQNFTFLSSQNHLIRASFYKQRAPVSSACVLYLHSFNGSRLEPISFIPEVIKKGFHFCSMDFAGCGNSGGQYVSLGYHERWDALRAIQQVRSRWGVKEFIVWGRSMGAVTAVKLYTLLLEQQAQGRMPNTKILGIVLDSAFISLKRMVVQVGQTRINLPQFLIKALFLMVGTSIEERANFKLDQLELEPDLEKIRCPVLLLASKQDTFVSHVHSEEIFSKLPLHQHKQLQYTSGEHHQQRSSQTIQIILKFIQQKYKLLESSRQLRISNCLRQDSSIEKRQKQRHELHKGEGEIAQQQRIQRPCSGERGQTVKFTSNTLYQEFASVGSQRKIEIQQDIRQYQTEKKIQSPQIRIIINNREIKAKDGLRSKSKPTFAGKILEIVPRQRVKEEKARAGSRERTEECQQDYHLNIISGKLKKRGRTQKDQFQFHTAKEETHVNTIKFEPNPPKCPQMVNQQGMQKSHKVSMSAQQYKNSQVKLLKGVIRLSPSKKRKLEKGRCSDQSKSMSNLNIAAYSIPAGGMRSFSRLDLVQSLQTCCALRKDD